MLAGSSWTHTTGDVVTVRRQRRRDVVVVERVELLEPQDRDVVAARLLARGGRS
jgi:hypothetical protein